MPAYVTLGWNVPSQKMRIRMLGLACELGGMLCARVRFGPAGDVRKGPLHPPPTPLHTAGPPSGGKGYRRTALARVPRHSHPPQKTKHVWAQGAHYGRGGGSHFGEGNRTWRKGVRPNKLRVVVHRRVPLPELLVPAGQQLGVVAGARGGGHGEVRLASH